MHWFTTCDCCGRSSLLPAFTIIEAGSARRHVICVRCAAHVALRENGALIFNAPCPERDGATARSTASAVADFAGASRTNAAAG